MSDGAKFQATNPNASTLSAAPPAAFGFLTSRPAAISVNGSSLGPVPGTLGLVAGPVSINSAATLAAPGGTIHVTSAAGIGEVPVDPRNTAGLTVASFGSVDIEDGSTLDAGNPNRLGPGGSVFIHAGALTINASEIGADNYGSGAGGVIMLRGERRSLCPTALLCTRRHWAAAAAPVYLFRPLRPAASRRCQPGADRQRRPGERGPACRIDKPADTDEWWPAGEHHPGTGNGGLVAVSADSMVIDGRANPQALTAIGSVTTGRGSAADVAVSAGTLTILANGEIVSLTAGRGNAGNVSLTAPGAVFIGGTSTVFHAGILSQATPAAAAMRARFRPAPALWLSIVNAGQISASTIGSGAGGDVNAQIGGKLSINGAGSLLTTTGILATTFLPGAKNAGNRLGRGFVDRQQRGDRQRHTLRPEAHRKFDFPVSIS